MSEHPELKKELLRASRMNSNELKCALISMNVVFKKGLQPQSYYKTKYIEELKKKYEKIPYISPFKQDKNDQENQKYSQSKNSNAKSSQKKKILDSSSQKFSFFDSANKKQTKDQNSESQSRYYESSQKNPVFGLQEFNKHLDNLIIQQSQLKIQFEGYNEQIQSVFNSANKQQFSNEFQVEIPSVFLESPKKVEPFNQVKFNKNVIDVIQEEYQQLNETKEHIQEQEMEIEQQQYSFSEEQISEEKQQPKLTMTTKQIQNEFKEIFQQKNQQKIKEDHKRVSYIKKEQLEYTNNQQQCKQYDIQNQNLQKIQKILLIVLALVTVAVLYNKLFASGEQQLHLVSSQNQFYNYEMEFRNSLKNNEIRQNQYYQEDTTTIGIISYQIQIEDFYRDIKIEMKNNNGQITFSQLEDKLFKICGQRNLQLYLSKLKRVINQKAEIYESLNTDKEAIYILKNFS